MLQSWGGGLAEGLRAELWDRVSQSVVVQCTFPRIPWLDRFKAPHQTFREGRAWEFSLWVGVGGGVSVQSYSQVILRYSKVEELS